MKILKNGTYRGLLADQHNLGLLADKHKRLDADLKEVTADRDRLKTELNRIGDELVEARQKLSRYHKHRNSSGKFAKKN